MDEDLAVDAIDDGIEEGGAEDVNVDETPQVVKDLAKELGWNENFDDGTSDKYVDAATYIRRSKNINSGLRKQIKEITNVVGELKAHNEQVYKAELKRLSAELDTLKEQKKSAIENGDVDQVEKIEEQIDEIKEKAVQPPKQSTVPNTVFNEWVEDNQWYRNDDEMRTFADKVGLEYEGLPFEKILKLVRRDVEAEFPEKFGGKGKGKIQDRPGASPVESGSRRSSSTKARSEADLSAAQRNIMNQFARHGVMTKAEYIADLVKRGEI